MPQAIGALILTAVGVSATATVAGVSLASLIGGIVFTGALLALQYLLTPKPSIPKPEDGKQTLKQPTPPRESAFGYDRHSGAYMLYEAKAGNSVDVVAFHDGKINEIIGFTLNDRPVTATGGWVDQPPDESFGPHCVYVEFRMGLPTETWFSVISNYLDSSIWNASYRGDGIASAVLICEGVEPKNVGRVYGGQLPNLGVTYKAMSLYDWRDGTQVQTDETTWKWSENPFVELAFYLTYLTRGCMALPWQRTVGQSLPYWTAAADKCDEAVPLAAGGSEKRYRSWGRYSHNSQPAEVISMLLATADGWMVPAGDGSILVRAGGYYEPTVILGPDDILDYTIARGNPDEDRVTSLTVNYLSADHGWNTTPAQAWELSSWTGRPRSESLDVIWCPSFTQARRLGKREFSRLSAAVSGTLRVFVLGCKALRERYVRVQQPEVTSLADIVVEVRSIEIDLMTMTAVITWIQADPNIDAWDPATEEGIPEPATERVSDDDLPTPTGLQLIPHAATANAAVWDLDVKVDDYARKDLVLVSRYHIYGDGKPNANWTEVAFPNAIVVAGVSITGTIRSLAGNATYEVQAATRSGSGRTSAWTIPVSVPVGNTSPPAAPTVNSVTIATNVATISLTAPNSPQVATLQLYRAASGAGFGAAVAVGSPINVSPNQTVNATDAPSIAGAYDWYATAISGLGNASPAGGPKSGTTTYDADVAAIFAAMTVAPTDPRKGLYNDLVMGLKTDGVWSRLDWLCTLAGHDAQATRINLRAPSKLLTASATPPTYTTDRGWKGIPASSTTLGLGERPGTFATYAQNDAHIGVVVRTAGTIANACIGAAQSAPILSIQPGAIGASRLNASSNANFDSGQSRKAHVIASRSNASQVSWYRNGVAGSTLSSASVAMSGATVETQLFRFSTTVFVDDEISAFHIGTGLTAAQAAAISSRLLTFLTAIGAN